jgi:hypothetical protein
MSGEQHSFVNAIIADDIHNQAIVYGDASSQSLSTMKHIIKQINTCFSEGNQALK